MGLRLTYKFSDRTVEDIADLDPMPVVLYPKGLMRRVYIVPITKPHPEIDPCAGCIAWNQEGAIETRVDCYDLPDCQTCVYVRATPENKLRHIAWRLESDK